MDLKTLYSQIDCQDVGAMQTPTEVDEGKWGTQHVIYHENCEILGESKWREDCWDIKELRES